ncbi:MAG: hypothetical protein Q9227_000582 [Pyrenula ochraceoflavens]
MNGSTASVDLEDSPARVTMTGIETAGLVLGAIPIVISALENFENFMDPVRAFLQYRGELSRARRMFVNYYTSYQQSIRIILSSITQPWQLELMLDNIDGGLWKDKRLEEALQRKLGSSYRAGMRIVEDIESTMKSILNHLNIEGADRVMQEGLEAIIAAHQCSTSEGGAPIFEFRKQINFTMKRRKIKEALKVLSTLIDMLDSYVQKEEKLDSLRPLRKTKVAVPLDVVQRDAAKLHNALLQAWCPDHSVHRTGLLLEQRLKTEQKGAVVARQNGGSADTFEPDCFAISLLQNTSAGKWLDAEFRILRSLETTGTQSHTPWLQQVWRISDIAFLQAEDGSETDVKNPYLRYVYHQDDKPFDEQRDHSSGTDSSLLLALGTMLVEIYHGQPIESLRQPEDLGANSQPNEVSNLMTARRWLLEQKAKGNITHAFHSAISYCLKSFIDPTIDLRDAQNAEAFEEQVLTLLEQERSLGAFKSSNSLHSPIRPSTVVRDSALQVEQAERSLRQLQNNECQRQRMDGLLLPRSTHAVQTLHIRRTDVQNQAAFDTHVTFLSE